MTDDTPERPAKRTAAQRLFAGVLALLFAWHGMPAAVPVAAATPVVHVATPVPGVSALRDVAKFGQPGTRLSAPRTHAGPDGAPPPVLPALAAQITPPAPVARSGWVATPAPAHSRQTGDLYSARAPPHRS